MKAGIKTTEFWLSLFAMILTALYASGFFTTGASAIVAGIAAATLTALGYTVTRAGVKKATTAANDNKAFGELVEKETRDAA